MVRYALVALAALAVGVAIGVGVGAARAAPAASPVTIAAAGAARQEIIWEYRTRVDNLTALIDGINTRDIPQGFEVFQIHAPGPVGQANTWVAILRKPK